MSTKVKWTMVNKPTQVNDQEVNLSQVNQSQLRKIKT